MRADATVAARIVSGRSTNAVRCYYVLALLAGIFLGRLAFRERSSARLDHSKEHKSGIIDLSGGNVPHATFGGAAPPVQQRNPGALAKNNPNRHQQLVIAADPELHAPDGGSGDETLPAAAGVPPTHKPSHPELYERVCGSPAVDGYAHVNASCLAASPTARWYRQHMGKDVQWSELVAHIEHRADFDGLAVVRVAWL